MRKIAVNIYGEGSDNIWSDCCRDGNSWIIVGNTKIREKYRILLTKIDEKGKILWNKTHGGEDEYEGRVILKTNEGYLIGGNAHGIATPTGGRDWQAYLLMVDENGNKLKERNYKIGENDAFYNIVEKEGYFYCFGESEFNKKKYVFVIQINKNLEIVNLWKYGGYDDILAGGFISNFLSYSYKMKGRWFGKLVRLDEEGQVVWEKIIDDMVIYSMETYNNHILLAGYKNDDAYILETDMAGEIKNSLIFKKGTFSNISASNGNIILSGEIKEHPSVFILNKNLEIIDRAVDADIRGWYERGCGISENKIIMLGYSSKNNAALMALVENLR